MKKSLTVLNGFETKSIQTPQTSLNSTSVLRRRFSLFRIKRPQPQQQQQSSINDISNENSNVQALQQIIDQLRHVIHKTRSVQTTVLVLTRVPDNTTLD
ncbi:unnamed protein product [Didymodactylos carnosus]|uniref:Uncharacterized protein n=1 Tax=Didymodactylos carnosus TaxID=1234261 RepID=A0A816H4S3_9BILA|nr:unnamed protein product [Didymodactylos carnosus]CAF4684293.1 unnamed protein product [Didymodactylos carnosus]